MILLVDWASSALGLHSVGNDGAVLASRQSGSGTRTVTDGDFAAVLAREAGDWLAASDAIYVVGMATGRGGWVETRYAPAPAGIEGLIAGARDLAVAGKTITFLPGVSVAMPLPDVMRGEEIKVFGLGDLGDAHIIVPGHHSKWVSLQSGYVAGFATYISGEVFALLAKDSIVSRLMPEASLPSDAAFLRGIQAARQGGDLGGGVLRRLFSARSLVLSGGLQPDDIRDYLFGLLTGGEIVEALTEFDAGVGSDFAILGTGALSVRYQQALRLFDRKAVLHEPVELAAAAIARLHRRRQV
ncbi:MAG TPA: 2-dehydro-3-deoxygalactonokinase [Devosiaceae bacterium]|jgi:2-dehydro-3-deoxygalactonokinase